MISEKRLKKWRAEALLNQHAPEITYSNIKVMAERILEMTQEIMDRRLLSRMTHVVREDQKQVAASIEKGDRDARLNR